MPASATAPLAAPASLERGSATAVRPVRTALIIAAAGIGVLAFGVRLAVMLRGGGLLGIGGYDDGVYYAAGDALVHGRLPYADFLLLHPPGIALLAAPFAGLGAVTSDGTGLAVARLAFEAIGGLNAALVVLVLRRFGLGAAITGGALYAVLGPAVWSERSVLLEPPATAGLLLSLLLLSHGRSRAHLMLAGVCAGWACDMKIWYVVPVAIIAASVERGRLRFVLGVAIAGFVVWLPSFLVAPTAMFREVILDQLGRPRTPGGLLPRVAGILGAHRVTGLDLHKVTVVLLLLALVATVLTLCTRGARVYAVMLVADAAVLLIGPSWYVHYGAFTAPALALCVGVGTSRVLRLLPAGRVLRPAVAVLVVAAVLGAGLHTEGAVRSGRAVPVAFTRRVAAVPGCITADDATMLALTDVLSRDVADRSCRVWPDVTGWTYDAADARTAHDAVVPRRENRRWQRLVLGYLRSGDATMVTRAGTGLDRASRAAIDACTPLVRVGRWALRPTCDRAGAPSGSTARTAARVG